MEDNSKKIEELLQRLDQLVQQQKAFEGEAQKLRTEILQLKNKGGELLKEKPKSESSLVEAGKSEKHGIETPIVSSPKPKPKKSWSFALPQMDFEKFIGENLFSKIGILITVIGAGIGVKYAIDNELISPLTRIILGYLLGIGLLGFAIKLRKSYANFSAVLFSGSMAILYLITYAGYSFYSLIPQIPSFCLMVFFTVATVVAALNYDRQVIALIGLVGAYTVPFLLSSDTHGAIVLFSYTAIINAGILAIAVKKYWKAVYYSAFALTWLIYFSWWAFDFNYSNDLMTGMGFAFVFFIIFYLTALAYKLIQKEKFNNWDIIFILANSFIFYGLGYSLLEGHTQGSQYLGLFTLGNAIIHFFVTLVVYKNKLADRNLFYFLSTLVLVFITITVPVQLDGNWVTLFWAVESLLLFWIGRSKSVRIYEYLSYTMMFLAFGSQFDDWMNTYNAFQSDESPSRINPILNIHFLSAILVALAFSGINYLLFKTPKNGNQYKPVLFAQELRFLIPGMLLLLLYFTFEVEIENVWKQMYFDSRLELDSNTYFDYDLLNFRSIWVVNYSMAFLSLFSIVNSVRINSKSLGAILIALNFFAAAAFISFGLVVLGDLRTSYMNENLSEYYARGSYYILIRYISLAFLAALILSSWKMIRTFFNETKFRIIFEIILHFIMICLLSSELVHWMAMAGSGSTFKFSLSILWGLYALFLIGMGIYRKARFLRIGAIILLSVTLLKLFFFDMSGMKTIPKTVVMVSLGLLLLVISFLYNKYKSVLFDEDKEVE